VAISNYSSLKASIENWSHRGDVNNLIDDFIDIAESEMFKHLKIRDMEARATATADTTSRFIELPDSFLEMRRFSVVSGANYYEIEARSPEAMSTSATTGRPRFFSITSQIEFDRKPDSAYTLEMQYYKTLTPLSATDSTNAVLTRFPMVYFYGSLMALHIWTSEIDKAEYYRSLLMSEIQTANKQDRRGRHGVAPRMTTERPTP
jgi:hypothetical protein